MSNKPKFDPSKPYTVTDEVSSKQAKPKFDPNKSFLAHISDGEEEIQNRNDGIVKDSLILGGQGAAFGFGDEIVGGINAAAGGDYEKSRDSARGRIGQARENLPYVGPVIEAAGSAVTSALVPPLRGGTLIRELGLSGLQSVGENTDIEKLPEEAAMSGGITLGANALGNVLKKTISPPEDILANAAGARGINYRKGEAFLGEDSAEEFADKLKDPAGLAARLDEKGFFSFGNRTLKEGKYTRSGGLEEAMAPLNVESMMYRVQQGLDYLGTENKRYLVGKKIPIQKIRAALDAAAEELVPAGEDYVLRAAKAKELADTAFQDLIMGGAISPGSSAVDASAVEGVKRKWQKKVSSSYETGKALSDITDVGVELRRKSSTALDKLVDTYGGPEYAKNNDFMRDLKTVEKMIHDKASRQRGYSGGGARLTNLKHLWGSLLENTV